MIRKPQFWVAVSLVGVLFFALGVMVFIKTYSRTAAIAPCHENLVLIDLAKRNWASDESKTSNDTPTWDDLRFYFPNWVTNGNYWTNGRPVCPDGGTYTIGRVGELPRCSVGGGYSHALLP
jgi:hypothetical protein